MSNIRFAWDFPTDSGTATASSEAGNMVVEHLQNQQPSSMWRGDGTLETIDFDLGDTFPINFFCFYAHNLRPDATVSLLLSNDNFSTVIGSHEFDLTNNPMILGFGLEPFGACPFGGTQICKPIPWLIKQCVEFVDTIPNSRYLKFTISDPDNADGYIQMGRLVAGTYWEPENNCSYGYSSQLVMNSQARASRSGALRARRRPQHREFEFNFDALTEADESYLDDMVRRCDMDKNVFVCSYPDVPTTSNFVRHTMLGFISGYGGITRANYLHRKSTLKIREAI